MTRYTNGRECIHESPTGDYVRYEVAQALYDNLKAILDNQFHSSSTGYCHVQPPVINAARAAMALAEKKGDA